MSPEPSRLHPADVESVAHRVVELLLEDSRLVSPARLLSAAEVAARLGVTRDLVYARADELGALRLGDGPRARLRFDPAKVTEALTARTSGRGSQVPKDAVRRAPERCTLPSPAAGIPLLPIGGLPGPANGA